MAILCKVHDRKRVYNKIQAHLEESPEVRPFPSSVTRLVETCKDMNANAAEFEAIIVCDPALSVRILRMANSPMLTPSQDVKSVRHAVALLGNKKIRSVAMSIAAANMFNMGEKAAQKRQNLWNHSVGVASVASCLAKSFFPVEPSDAFLAGIFHDVGKLVFYDVIPDEYAELEASFHGRSLVEEERFVLGTSHQDIGRNSAERWEMPVEIQTAIGWHHQPSEAPEFQEFAEMISIADTMAKNWGIGSALAPYTEIPCEHSFTNQDLKELEEQSREAFRENQLSMTS